ncbi:hypothetical protein SDC9_188367 [bioreactor metagenome]|uniref:Uncharacterized protein n=1 Tax=bioreactor metagenome TaxID=1076179 RepID=A0A645HPD7_9ZZZZ
MTRDFSEREPVCIGISLCLFKIAFDDPHESRFGSPVLNPTVQRIGKQRRIFSDYP